MQLLDFIVGKTSEYYLSVNDRNKREPISFCIISLLYFEY